MTVRQPHHQSRPVPTPTAARPPAPQGTPATVRSDGPRRRTLARRRRICGYSQEAFAEAVGVDRTTVVRWEAGQTEPQPWHRRKVATVLDVSLAELDAMLRGPAGTPDLDTCHRRHDPRPVPAVVRQRAAEIVTAHVAGHCPYCRPGSCPRLARATALLVESGHGAGR